MKFLFLDVDTGFGDVVVPCNSPPLFLQKIKIIELPIYYYCMFFYLIIKSTVSHTFTLKFFLFVEKALNVTIKSIFDIFIVNLV